MVLENDYYGIVFFSSFFMSLVLFVLFDICHSMHMRDGAVPERVIFSVTLFLTCNLIWCTMTDSKNEVFSIFL